MFTTAIRTKTLTSLASALTVATLLNPVLVLADQPSSGLIPVPPMRSVPKPMSGEAQSDNVTAASRKLSWRPSQKVTPQQTIPEQSIARQVSSQPMVSPNAEDSVLMIPSVNQTPTQNVGQSALPATTQPVQPASLGAMIAGTKSPLQMRSRSALGEMPAVAQVAYTQDVSDSGAGGFYVPETTDGALPPRVATQPAVDPFKDPFGDLSAGPAAPSDRLIARPQDADGGFAIPQSQDGSPFQLPGNATDQIGEAGDVQDTNPDFNLPSPLQSPSDQPANNPPSLSMPENDSLQEEAEDRNDRGREDDGSSKAQSSPGRPTESARRRLGEYATASCDELRERIAARTIRDISLDISPPFHPDILAQDAFDERFNEFKENQLPRDWRNQDGEIIARGTFLRLAYEHAVIEQQGGGEVEVRLARLSEPDLAYITEEWGLPSECQLPNIAFQPRQWLPMTMTWKASALCHKPLYFEEVGLERYGHTTGPFAQPVISTAHFFVNIAVLPYKMGIHPPNECQYALGYYRPGNCAPWIIPPVPLSLRGAIYQAGAIGAGIWAIP